MVDTRQDKLQSFKHILENILDDGVEGPIFQALTNAYIQSISDMMMLDEDDIKNLTYKYIDTTGTTSQVPLEMGRRGMIKAFKAYIRHLGNDIIFDTIQEDDFDQFRIHTYNPDSPTLPTRSDNIITNANNQKLIDDFCKGIKRDKSQYATLQEDKQWDNWYRSTLATARSHGCEQIFDPTFLPSTPDDTTIFDEKQKFM